jgi:uracil-DNA glycosylase family protein
MAHAEGVAPVPARLSLPALRKAAAGCTACDLYKTGTQTVFGEGLATARALFLGEQPGDQEDKLGRPFVGPAGKLLDRALEEAGIDRDQVYVTNVVKHFKWVARGKRRLHQKPDAREQAACRPWLLAELKVLEPALIVCLGATAAQSLLGKTFRVTKQRGEVLQHELGRIVATVHPSSILRAPDDEARARETALFVKDLKVVAKLLR